MTPDCYLIPTKHSDKDNLLPAEARSPRSLPMWVQGEHGICRALIVRTSATGWTPFSRPLGSPVPLKVGEETTQFEAIRIAVQHTTRD